MDRIEAFLRAEIGAHPRDLEEYTAQTLGVPFATVRKRIQDLVSRGVFEERSAAGERELVWKPVLRRQVDARLEEDRVWTESVAPGLKGIPDNVRALLEYGTTEMVNNVRDHSDASELVVVVRELSDSIEIYVEDDGIGIFRKLQRELGLEDPRHAALELAKGKLTTDPSRHTGEGIFFTARVSDAFLIWSSTTVCGHAWGGPWHVFTKENRPGTTVRIVVRLDTKRTLRSVFDEFAPPSQDMGFTKTAIQADLARQPGEGLGSRSQARRLLARCEHFREITIDFRGIESIGPAFADEVFRVFPGQHPGIVLRHQNASDQVLRMIERALKNAGEQASGD